MFLEDYKYWLAYRKNKTSYYRCARYKSLCPGRCVVQDSKVRSSTEHNHAPEPDRVLVDKFRKVLTQRAATETTDIYMIYWEEASQRHPDAALLYTFTAAESAMRKARRKHLPQAPNTIEELADIVANSMLFRIHSGGSSRDPFYLTTLTHDDGTAVIFAHMKTLEVVGRIDELQMDVALTVPATPTTPAYHLLIVHTVQASHNIPILYAIMTSKTQPAYSAIFVYIRENLSSYIVPNVIMSDYCPEMQSALAFTFPEASIRGYWFHYTDAVLNYVKHKDLLRETAGGAHGSSGLRMLLVLPLLPAEYMSPGLESIRKWANEKQVDILAFGQLFDYVELKWLQSVGASKMSIYGLPHGIYNHIQTFNKEMHSSLKTADPLIWNILESITHTATRAFVKCSKRLKSLQPKPPNKSQQVLDTIIKNATQLWIQTPEHLRNPLHFLQLASHCITNTVNYGHKDNAGFGGTSVASTCTSPISKNSSLASPDVPTKLPKLEKSANFTIPRPLNTASSKSKSNNIQPKSPLPITIDTPIIMIVNEEGCNGAANMDIAEPTILAPEQTEKLNVKRAVQASTPPPLAFYPRKLCRTQRPIIFSSTEPPPLVPIRNFNIS